MASSNRSHFLLNLASQYGATFVSAALGLISAPISLRYWGVDQYGIWTVIMSLGAYLAVSGSGVDVAAGILMTKTTDPEAKKAIQRRSLVLVCAVVAVVALAFALIDASGVEWVRFVGRMHPDRLAVAKRATTVFIVFFLLNLPFGVVANSFAAYERVYVNNALNMCSSVCQLCVLLIVVGLKLDLVSYALMHGLVNVTVNVSKCVALWLIARTWKGRAGQGPAQAGDPFGDIFLTGFRLSVYGLAVMVSANVGNLIISNNIDVSSVTPYSFANRLFTTAFLFLTAINISMAPLFGKEYGRGSWEWLSSQYARFHIATVTVGGAIWLGGMLFFRDILLVWVGPPGYPGFAMIALLGVSVFCASLSNINYVIVNSFNYTKGIALISWAELAVFIGVSLLTVKSLGAVSVALGAAAGSIVITQWALPLLIRSRSQGRIVADYRYAGIVSLFLAAMVPVAWALQTQVDSWEGRCAGGLTVAGLYVLLCVTVMPQGLREDVRAYVAANGARFLGQH